MLYSCTHAATVGVRGLKCRILFLVKQLPSHSRSHSVIIIIIIIIITLLIEAAGTEQWSLSVVVDWLTQ